MVGFFDKIAGVDELSVSLCAWIRLRFTKAYTGALYGVGKFFQVGSGMGGCFMVGNPNTSQRFIALNTGSHD